MMKKEVLTEVMVDPYMELLDQIETTLKRIRTRLKFVQNELTVELKRASQMADSIKA